MFPINEGDVFSISFKHSVNQSTVTEIFQTRQGQILLTALEFEAFGAGMPTELEPGQTLLYLETGGMRIENFDRIIHNFYIIVGSVDMYLQIGEQTSQRLQNIAAPGEPVRFIFQRRGIR